MSTKKSEVWVTGIGLVSSLGEGLETHWAQLTSGEIPVPSVDTENQAPYLVHPIVNFDIAAQIPKRSDQRQMGRWQHLGAYAAGLALDDAGIAHNPDLTGFVKEHVSFIAPVFVYPGEDEMRALAENGVMLMKGNIKAKEYSEENFVAGLDLNNLE